MVISMDHTLRSQGKLRTCVKWKSSSLKSGLIFLHGVPVSDNTVMSIYGVRGILVFLSRCLVTPFHDLGLLLLLFEIKPNNFFMKLLINSKVTCFA